MNVSRVNPRDHESILMELKSAAQKRNGRSQEWLTKARLEAWTREQDVGRTRFQKTTAGGALLAIGAVRFDTSYEATAEGFRTFSSGLRPSAMTLEQRREARDRGVEITLETPGKRVLLSAIVNAFERGGSWTDLAGSVVSRYPEKPFILRSVIASDNMSLLSKVRRKGFDGPRANSRAGIETCQFDVESVMQTMELDFASVLADPEASKRLGRQSPHFEPVPETDIGEAWLRFQQFKADEAKLIIDPSHLTDLDAVDFVRAERSRTAGLLMRDWCAFYLAYEEFASKARRKEVFRVFDDEGDLAGFFLVGQELCGVRPDAPTVQVEAVAVRSQRSVGDTAVQVTRRNFAAAAAVASAITRFVRTSPWAPASSDPLCTPRPLNVMVHFPVGSMLQNAFARRDYSTRFPVDRWYQEVILWRVINDRVVEQIRRQLGLAH